MTGARPRTAATPAPAPTGRPAAPSTSRGSSIVTGRVNVNAGTTGTRRRQAAAACGSGPTASCRCARRRPRSAPPPTPPATPRRPRCAGGNGGTHHPARRGRHARRERRRCAPTASPAAPRRQRRKGGVGGKGGDIDLVAGHIGAHRRRDRQRRRRRLGQRHAGPTQGGRRRAAAPCARGRTRTPCSTARTQLILTRAAPACRSARTARAVGERAPTGLAVERATGALTFSVAEPRRGGLPRPALRQRRAARGGARRDGDDRRRAAAAAVVRARHLHRAGVRDRRRLASHALGPVAFRGSRRPTQTCTDAPELKVGKALKVKLKALKKSKWKLNVTVHVAGRGHADWQAVPQEDQEEDEALRDRHAAVLAPAEGQDRHRLAQGRAQGAAVRSEFETRAPSARP